MLPISPTPPQPIFLVHACSTCLPYSKTSWRSRTHQLGFFWVFLLAIDQTSLAKGHSHNTWHVVSGCWRHISTLGQFSPCIAADYLLWAACLNRPSTLEFVLLEERLISISSSTYSHLFEPVSAQLEIFLEAQGSR